MRQTRLAHGWCINLALFSGTSPLSILPPLARSPSSGVPLPLHRVVREPRVPGVRPLHPAEAQLPREPRRHPPPTRPGTHDALPRRGAHARDGRGGEDRLFLFLIIYIDDYHCYWYRTVVRHALWDTLPNSRIECGRSPRTPVDGSRAEWWWEADAFDFFEDLITFFGQTIHLLTSGYLVVVRRSASAGCVPSGRGRGRWCVGRTRPTTPSPANTSSSTERYTYLCSFWIPCLREDSSNFSPLRSFTGSTSTLALKDGRTERMFYYYVWYGKFAEHRASRCGTIRCSRSSPCPTARRSGAAGEGH